MLPDVDACSCSTVDTQTTGHCNALKCYRAWGAARQKYSEYLQKQSIVTASKVHCVSICCVSGSVAFHFVPP